MDAKEATGLLVEKITEAHYTEIEKILGFPITGDLLESGLESHINRALTQMSDEERFFYEVKYLDKLTEDRTSLEAEKYVCSAIYGFHGSFVRFEKPDKIVKETECCYITRSGRRYLKDVLGTAKIKSTAHYPYVEAIMVNATNAELTAAIRKWFEDFAEAIQEGKFTI